MFELKYVQKKSMTYDVIKIPKQLMSTFWTLICERCAIEGTR